MGEHKLSYLLRAFTHFY